MRPGHAALRKGRSSVAGQIYLVTFATHGRYAHFADWRFAREASSLLASAEAWPEARLLAWVLMPDHWHGLVQLAEGANLSRSVGVCKGRSARILRQRHESLGPVWGRGFHDRALRHADDLRAVTRYIVMNPIRAGLVRSVREYPYWDAVWL